MGIFNIKNLTDKIESEYVCNLEYTLNSTCKSNKSSWFANQDDSLSLYYEASADRIPISPTGTKVHFYCVELERDLIVFPSGSDTLNSSSWCNPYLGETLQINKEYHIFAYDEYENSGTYTIALYLVKPINTPTRYNCSDDCTTAKYFGTYESKEECLTKCAEPIPQGYSCLNLCDTKINYGTYSTKDDCIAKCSTVKTYNKCIGGVCKKVIGNSPNECDIINSSCGITSNLYYLDFVVEPYPWYSHNDMSDYLITRLGDINGYIFNIFSEITDYTYINTEILSNTPEGKSTIRITLKQTSLMSLVAPALLVTITTISIWLFAIVIIFGIITGWKFTLSGFIEQITGNEFSKEDVAAIVLDQNGVVDNQLLECEKETDPITVANCKKHVLCGVANGLYNKKILTTDCSILNIEQDIDDCTSQYKIDNDLNKYNTCIENTKNIKIDDMKDSVPKTVSVCSTLGLSDQDCTYVKYGAMALAGLFIIKTIKDAKNK